jgi:hypothetical protein
MRDFFLARSKPANIACQTRPKRGQVTGEPRPIAVWRRERKLKAKSDGSGAMLRGTLLGLLRFFAAMSERLPRKSTRRRQGLWPDRQDSQKNFSHWPD